MRKIMKDKQHLDYVEFYISHTCNFGCEGCNRFNNYNFAGHERWKDSKKKYEKWSERINFSRYTILGGEPMSNPDIIQWIKGIRKLWPESRARLSTNGSYVHKFTEEFYNTLLETNTQLEIGLHNFSRTELFLKTISDFLVHPLDIRRTPEDLDDLPNFSDMWKKNYNAIKAEEWPKCDSYKNWDSLPEWIRHECETVYNFSPDRFSENLKDYTIYDANGVKVIIQKENWFHQSALIKQPEKNNFRLHNSDPIKAHNTCDGKYCHHFIQGKLNKCGQSFLFAEFDKQFELDLSQEDRNLIYSYNPATVDMTENELQKFIDNIKNPIDQCKFCPEHYVFKEINSGAKKDKFGNKKRHS